MASTRPLIVAALGDVHGRLDAAVTVLRRAEAAAGVAIDLVLQVGDLEAHRHPADLASMYAPHREKRLGDFPAYVEGRRHFPWPLHFIGGNHEPYGCLHVLPNGGTLAASVHYLGRAGCRELHGLRVAFLSGIHDARFLHADRPPPGPLADGDHHGQRALSCFTAGDLAVLRSVRRPHLLLLHEWPFGLVRPEDHEPGEPRHRRLRWGETGVPLLRQLVEEVGPERVLCGHLHRPYGACLTSVRGEPIAVHCLGRGDEDGGCSLFSFDGARLELLGPALVPACTPPGLEEVNEELRQIAYPSTHQYRLEQGRVVPAPSAAARLEELAGVLPPGRWRSLLDIGCGKGMFLLWAWQRLGLERLVGVDASADMVRAARRAAACLGAPAAILHGPPGEFRAGLAPADLVFVFHCYHYLYFGSLFGTPGVPSHAWWFHFLAAVTADTLVFANTLDLDEAKRQDFRARGASEEALRDYHAGAILAAARRHFDVTAHPQGGGRPYLVMRRRSAE